MAKTKKTKQQGNAPTADRPRLVKAGELAAREAAQAAKAERTIEAKSKDLTVNPALKRAPRNAVEARDMFNSLFNEAA